MIITISKPKKETVFRWKTCFSQNAKVKCVKSCLTLHMSANVKSHPGGDFMKLAR